MNKRVPISAVLLALGWQSSALAELSVEERLTRMEQTVARLQRKIEHQEATIDKQAATIARQTALLEGAPKRLERLEEEIETQHAAGAGARGLELAGLIEVEAGHHSPYDGDAESDIVLATFELAVAARLGDWVEVGGSLLYEEDETELEVDTAYATFANPGASPFFISAGQIYVPFGAFETNMVSDPLTLEIGETRETALRLGFERDGFNGSLYLFNGSYKKDGRNRIGTWGANLGYVAESGIGTWGLGAGWISDIGDSDTLQGLVGGDAARDRVGGWTVNAGLAMGAFNLIGEYLGAGEAFAPGTLPWRLKGACPAAWNLEAGYSFELIGRDARVAVGWQGSREALALELPRERLLLALSLEIFDRTALSFEWAHDRDYGTGDGGTGKTADTATAQVAFEF